MSSRRAVICEDTAVAVVAHGTGPGGTGQWWRAWRARFGLAEVCGPGARRGVAWSAVAAK